MRNTYRKQRSSSKPRSTLCRAYISAGSAPADRPPGHSPGPSYTGRCGARFPAGPSPAIGPCPLRESPSVLLSKIPSYHFPFFRRCGIMIESPLPLGNRFAPGNSAFYSRRCLNAGICRCSAVRTHGKERRHERPPLSLGFHARRNCLSRSGMGPPPPRRPGAV